MGLASSPPSAPSPIVAAQSISSGEAPEIRSNYLFFLEIISTSASADDVCSTARWATVVFRSISQLAGDPWGARSIPRRGRLSVRVLVAFNAVEPERQAQKTAWRSGLQARSAQPDALTFALGSSRSAPALAPCKPN